MKKIILLLLLLFTSCGMFKDYYSNYYRFDLIKKNNLILLKLTLNDKPALFLIDTGANKSLLDINKAEKYGFMYWDKPFEKYVGIGGVQNIYIVFEYKIKELFIPMLGINLEELNPYFKTDNLEIIGLIGSDFLTDKNAIIDYQNLKLYYK